MSTNFIYQGYSQNDRITMLKNQAVKSDVKTYNRALSEEEITREKDKYASDAIELDRQKQELKATVERLKSGISSMENLMTERLEKIKTGQTEATGTLYGLADYAKNTMNWFDSFGQRVNSVPLTPDERQGTLFIGDAPAESGAEDDGATYVDFEEAHDTANSGDHTAETAESFIDDLNTADADYQQSVDDMYNEPETPGAVTITQTDPVEDKPAKKRKTTKKPTKGQEPI